MSAVPPPSRTLGLLSKLVVGVFIAVLIWSVLLPRLTGGGPTKTMRIVNNLRQIEMMKEMWASDHRITGSVQVTEHDLAPYAYGYSSNGLARPVIGERYIVHRLGVGPEAQLTRAYGKLPQGTVIRLRPDTNRLFRIFLPKGGAVNRSQPIRPETNAASSTAASRG